MATSRERESELARGSRYIELLLSLPREERRRVLLRLTHAERAAFMRTWEIWARPSQLWRPGPERDTFYLAGRGWGKTRVGAEAVRWLAKHPDVCGGEIAIAGRTAGDRDATMLYGPSGLMRILPDDERPKHRKQDRELVFPGGRVRARLMSGDVPESFRGPGFGAAWTDELPHWARARESWEQLEYTLREGCDFPRTINTSTPLPTSMLLSLLFELDESGKPIADPDGEYGFRVREGVRIVRGSSYENRAHLAPGYFKTTIARHEGTRMGGQEINGDLLLDMPGALWKFDWFRRAELAPALRHVVIGVDPAGSRKKKSAHTGIVAAGASERGRGGSFALLADETGMHGPEAWANIVIDLYDLLGASEVVAETNYGGELVRNNVLTVAKLPEVIARRRARGTDRPIVIVEVSARASKGDRAALVSGLWQQGRVVHVGDPRRWRVLEYQMTAIDPYTDTTSLCDARDAAVHAIRFLLGDELDGPAPWPTAGQLNSFMEKTRRGMLGG